jgi:hypothetical protein
MTAPALAPGAATLAPPSFASILRLTVALPAAAAITLALFFLMRALIWTDTPPPADVVEVPAFVVAEIPP